MNSLEDADKQLAKLWAHGKGYKDFEDIIIEPGSTSGIRKIQDAQLALGLAEKFQGILGPPQVARRIIFEITNFPERERYLKMIEEAEAVQPLPEEGGEGGEAISIEAARSGLGQQGAAAPPNLGA